jgi:3-oxoacyl-[acyl-carrier-protein] synthase II
VTKRRVVATGVGLLTPVGNDVATTWRALLTGCSGAAPITHFDAQDFPVRFAAEVKGFDPLAYMDRKEVRRTDPYVHYAMAAAVQAMTGSGVRDWKEFDPNRCAVIVGSGLGGLATFEEQHSALRDAGPRRVSAFFVPLILADIAAGIIAMRLGAKGPNYATVSACATGAHAIGAGMRMIQYGDADTAICGGSEAAVAPMGIGGFASMKALSERNDSPGTASRPFDATRDGFVLGEGAGVVILEEMTHAMRRGATIYGEVAGFGATADAHHLTAPAPRGEGAQRAMHAALADAGLRPADVQYVNAHGTSTPTGDQTETEAIKAVFGDYVGDLHVSSTKGATGHMLGAAGAAELIFALLAIRDGIIPPTINYETPDPACDLNYTPNRPVKRPIDAALSNSFGFGGHNAALIVRRVDGVPQ